MRPIHICNTIFKICCNLYNKRKTDKKGKRAIVTAEGGEIIVTRLKSGCVVAYKYMRFDGEREISVRVKGGEGKIAVFAGEQKLADILVPESAGWQKRCARLKCAEGVSELRFEVECKGEMMFSRFEIR